MQQATPNQQSGAMQSQAALARSIHLPSELVERILKEMSADDASLSGCLLVCREWTRIAYPYHFRRLSYCADDLKERLPLELIPAPLVRDDAFSFGDFFAFLRNAPMICACVEMLELEGKLSTDVKVTLDLGTLRAILELLPKLRSLQLRVQAFENFLAPMGTLLDPTPIRLHQLVLDRPECMPAETVSLLSLFTSVQYLAFDDVALPDEFETDIVVPDTQISVKSIYVAAPWYTFFQTWVEQYLPLLDPDSLSTLHIMTPENEFDDTDTMELLTAAVGHNLEELTYGWIEREHTTPLDLSNCPKLRSLNILVSTPCLGLVPTEQTKFSEGSWPATLHTLVNAPPSVRAIDLEFLLVDDTNALFEWDDDGVEHHVSLAHLAAQLELLDWSLLDLAIDSHPNLETITIKVLFGDLLQDGEDVELFAEALETMLVERCFSTPARRQLLRVNISVKGDMIRG